MIDNKTIEQITKENIDVTICKDDFIIIQSWDDVHKIEEITHKDIDTIFDSWGFSDEYSQCDECYNSIHLYTYDKKDYAILNKSEFICGSCIRDNETDIESYVNTLINNPKNANTILKSNHLENIGFTKCNCNDHECNFSSGLREGNNDDPKEIMKNAIKKNPDKEYIFDITNISMFDLEYTIWNRPKHTDED